MSEVAKKTYFRVRLRNVPDPIEDRLTTHSFECGASGVSEALAYTQPNLTYDPRLVPVKTRELDVFFPEKPGADFFDGLRDLDTRIQAETHEEENKDWLAEWKKGFKPFPLVGPYWIVPSWEEVPAECKMPLRIDPGMAFGTGTHATTQMMSFFIHKLAEKNLAKIPQWGLLDVGTGTAVLAMLAARAGFGLITGVEIDPEARRTARQNIELNDLKEIEISDKLIEDLKQPYDVVVANIIDGVLVEIQQDLLRLTKEGGHLLVTGILQEHDDEFFSKFIDNQPLKVLRRIEKEEWVGYWLEKEKIES